MRLFTIIISTLAGLLLCACLPSKPAPIKEARGVWLSRFEYTEYSTTRDQDSIQQYIAHVIEHAAQANFNIIFFQVRGNADAYYESALEPWGSLLTDELGVDPGWDPLDFAIEQAHHYGLELHAWLNTFPAWRGVSPPDNTIPVSPYLEHPDWIVADSSGTPTPLANGYVSFSPGNPAVHDHILNIVSDIVRRYDIDGIHFDYIRYPEAAPDSGFSHDAVSQSRFASAEGNPWRLDWADWQRDQINRFVIRAYNRIHDLDSTLKVSAAVIGSYDESGWNAYHAVYQDPRRWAELGKIDFITPMIYWPRKHRTQPFTQRALEYNDEHSFERLVFPGIASYRYQDKRGRMSWSEVIGQIEDLREARISGMVFFDARSLQNHWEDLREGPFATYSNVPPMIWKDDQPPGAPHELTFTRAGGELSLSWVPPDDDDVVRYNIYYSPRLPIDSTKSKNLFLVTPSARVTADFGTTRRTRRGFYAVSALDRAWNESALSDPVEIQSTR